MSFIIIIMIIVNILIIIIIVIIIIIMRVAEPSGDTHSRRGLAILPVSLHQASYWLA